MPCANVTEHLVGGSALSGALLDALQTPGNLSVPSLLDAFLCDWLQAAQERLSEVGTIQLRQSQRILRELLDRCSHTGRVV